MLKYSYPVRLRTSDFDTKDHILPSAVLEIFQDIAGAHADELKIGFHELIADHKIWMVVRTKFEVVGKLKPLHIVQVETYPEHPGKIEMNRDYYIKDDKGNVLVKGVSKWVIVDYDTRRITRVKNFSYGDEIYVEEKIYEDLYKLEDFDCSSLTYSTYKTHYLDLDHNGHVNNTKYASFILEAIPELRGKDVQSFEINYLNEIPVDEEVKLFYIKEDNLYRVKGCHEDMVCFIAEIKILEESK